MKILKRLANKYTNFESDAKYNNWAEIYTYINKYFGNHEKKISNTTPALNNQDEILWLVPGFSAGSGGHTTIFRVVKYLHQKGFKQRIIVVPPYKFASLARQKATFQSYNLPVEIDLEYFEESKYESGKVIIATSYLSSYFAKSIPSPKYLLYFVQDYEPYFFPRGDEYTLAEKSYTNEFFYIAMSPWLGKVLKENHNMNGIEIPLGYSPNEYYLETREKRSGLCFYSRASTPRRGTELGLAVLRELKKEVPELNMTIFGDDSISSTSSYNSLGLATTDQLRELYNDCELGMTFSFTNYSLTPQEMNACGLPVIDIDWEGNILNYQNRRAVKLIPAQIPVLVNQIKELLHDKKILSGMQESAVRDVKTLSWEDCLASLDALISSKPN